MAYFIPWNNSALAANTKSHPPLKNLKNYILSIFNLQLKHVFNIFLCNKIKSLIILNPWWVFSGA